MKTSEPIYDVLIIGAGPAGMISALSLAQHGITSLVLERRHELQAHPKAHELSGRSIEILHRLGFSHEELAAEASPHDDASKILFCGTIGEEFGSIDLTVAESARQYKEHLAAETPYLNVSQVELEKVMLAHIRACTRTNLLYHHQWESLEQDGDVVKSRVTDLEHGATKTMTSRYVICADGAASRSRQALGVRMIGPEKIRDFVSAYFRADLSKLVHTRGKLYFIFSPKTPGSIFIAHHIEKRWVFHTPVMTPHEKMEDFTAEVMTARIKAALGRDDIPIEVESTSGWRMTAQVADRFRVGRAFLVGDAAHRFPPSGGLGMNSGIGDAYNLCWKLALVLQNKAPESLLDTYEVERRPVVQTNCSESRRNFDRMGEIVEAFGVTIDEVERAHERLHTGAMAALPEPIRQWGQRQMQRYGESILARYERDPDVRQRVLSAIADQRSHFDRIGLDLGYSYEEGALLSDGTPAEKHDDPVSTYIASTRPGARFPHFWLDGNRRKQSSHTLLHAQRSTLICGSNVRVVASDLESMRPAAADLGIELVSLAMEAIPLAYRAAVHTRCQIEADGALLVRPDGHVAWRQCKGVELSDVLLRSIFHEAYCVYAERSRA